MRKPNTKHQQPADSFDRTIPTILYTVANLRVVLRPLDRWSEGYVDIERRSTDAVGAVRWNHVESTSLSLDGFCNEPLRELLIHLLLEKDSRLLNQLRKAPR